MNRIYKDHILGPATVVLQCSAFLEIRSTWIVNLSRFKLFIRPRESFTTYLTSLAIPHYVTRRLTCRPITLQKQNWFRYPSQTRLKDDLALDQSHCKRRIDIVIHPRLHCKITKLSTNHVFYLSRFPFSDYIVRWQEANSNTTTWTKAWIKKFNMTK